MPNIVAKFCQGHPQGGRQKILTGTKNMRLLTNIVLHLRNMQVSPGCIHYGTERDLNTLEWSHRIKRYSRTLVGCSDLYLDWSMPRSCSHDDAALLSASAMFSTSSLTDTPLCTQYRRAQCRRPHSNDTFLCTQYRSEHHRYSHSMTHMCVHNTGVHSTDVLTQWHTCVYTIQVVQESFVGSRKNEASRSVSFV